MNYDVFETGMEEIFATFGKKKPETYILKAIYKRVESLPPEFMSYCVGYFEEQKELPKNFGLCLVHDVWPQFLAKHPEMKASNAYGRCNNCLPQIPGFREVYEPFMLDGELRYTPRIFRCPCGNAPNPNNDPAPTDAELLSHGWLLKMPFSHTKEETLARWGKVFISEKKEDFSWTSRDDAEAQEVF